MLDDLPSHVPLDRPRLLAAVELVGRAAARQLELGWESDDGPRPGEWYASAFYKGARVTVEKQEGPDAAVEALAFKLMDGGECVHCGRLLFVAGVGYRWGGDSEPCTWYRRGEHWLRGCDGAIGAPAGGLNREQRRRQAKAKGLR